MFYYGEPMCESMPVAKEVLLHIQSTTEVPLSKGLNPRNDQAVHVNLPALHILQLTGQLKNQTSSICRHYPPQSFHGWV